MDTATNTPTRHSAGHTVSHMSEKSTFTPTPRPCWIAGTAEQGASTITVTHPYDGSDVAEVAVPSAEQVRRAIHAAAGGTACPVTERVTVLEQLARELWARAEEIAETITAENGKPLYWAELEVDDAARTCLASAEETRKLAETPRSLESGGDGIESLALTRRHPRGPVLSISPASSPLGAVARDIAAAIAAGAPVVVKPASATPLSALLLGEILAEADLPAGTFSVLPLPAGAIGPLLDDPRLPVISFSGSAAVCGSVLNSAPRKHVLATPGGGCTAIICGDWNSESDMDIAAERVAGYGNYQAGQSPVAVQRVLVHSSVVERFTAKLVRAVAALHAGNPHDPKVTVGPMIDEASAERVGQWVAEAVASGARLLVGGGREGATVQPTVLADVPAHATLTTSEVFGPVLTVSTVDSDTNALERLRDGQRSCVVGLFTHDTRFALDAGNQLDDAGVIVGDLPGPHADPRGPGARRAGINVLIRDLTTEQVTVFAGLRP